MFDNLVKEYAATMKTLLASLLRVHELREQGNRPESA
jgi:hypothetical protein